MDSERFWALIDAAWDESGSDVDEYGDALKRTLSPLGPEELVSFNTIFSECLARAYRWDLWAAASVINGGCSDDGFVYFRAWLIMQGREIYEQALQDPDSLAELCTNPGEEAECEDVLYIAGGLYEEKTGEELDGSAGGHGESHEPSGTRWEDSDLPRLLPKLTQIHWSE